MPITIPIEGASEAPSGEEFYSSALGSIHILNEHSVVALGSIAVVSEGTTRALSSISPMSKMYASVYGSIRIGLGTTDIALGSAEIVGGDSFLILVDLLSARLAGPLE